MSRPSGKERTMVYNGYSEVFICVAFVQKEVGPGMDRQTRYRVCRCQDAEDSQAALDVDLHY